MNYNSKWTHSRDGKILTISTLEDKISDSSGRRDEERKKGGTQRGGELWNMDERERQKKISRRLVSVLKMTY